MTGLHCTHAALIPKLSPLSYLSVCVLAAAKVHANLSHTTPANPHLLVGGGSLVVLDEAELLLQSAECGQRRRRSKLHFLSHSALGLTGFGWSLLLHWLLLNQSKPSSTSHESQWSSWLSVLSP